MLQPKFNKLQLNAASRGLKIYSSKVKEFTPENIKFHCIKSNHYASFDTFSISLSIQKKIFYEYYGIKFSTSSH